MKKYRYVEVTDGTRFRAVLPPEPMSVRAAEALAREDAAEAWGRIPLDFVEVFVTRTVTAEKHARLVEAARKGTLDPDWWLTNRTNVEV